MNRGWTQEILLAETLLYVSLYTSAKSFTLSPKELKPGKFSTLAPMTSALAAGWPSDRSHYD